MGWHSVFRERLKAGRPTSATSRTQIVSAPASVMGLATSFALVTCGGLFVTRKRVIRHWTILRRQFKLLTAVGAS